MSVLVLKRLLIVLVAVAFVGATLPANCIGAAAMQSAAAMTAPMGDPCADDSNTAPATDLAKMLCGALACAGIAGLPTRQIVATPDIGRRAHPPSTTDPMAGISLKPDPFPPRPTARA